jgi:acyl phosphate:glycerol-3-phosphate acyltransferase
MSGTAIVILLVCYLLGSISGSLIVGRIRGVDIRTQGSGNAGATNAFRTQGKLFALITVLIDAGKGALASLLLGPLIAAPWGSYACALAAVIGHCFPVFFGFRGGKGAGTAFGALLVLLPGVALLALGVWLCSLILSGYVGVSTVLAALAGAAYVGIASPLDALSAGCVVATLLLIAVLHHGNLRRLYLGTEHRFQGARLLRRIFTKRDSNIR